VERAAADPAARIYAFGQRWGPEASTRDKVFGFLPGNGVHDIHMNQGNSQQFLDRDKRRLVLDAGSLAAGDSIRVLLRAPVALGNRGGLISLLDVDGLKVDGVVAYTKAQAEREGWSLVWGGGAMTR
jgi:hypothetical protein